MDKSFNGITIALFAFLKEELDLVEYAGYLKIYVNQWFRPP